MNYRSDKPLMVQSDFTVLLEVNHPRFGEVRNFLSRFADLIKSPEHLHTYRITRLSLWNAASAGLKAEEIVQFLQANAKFDIPQHVFDDIRHFMNRYGLIRLELSGTALVLAADDREVMKELQGCKSLVPLLGRARDDGSIEIAPKHRGTIKQELIKLGYPVQDLAGYHQGESLPIRLRDSLTSGKPFTLRDYQLAAINSFYRNGSVHGGSGVLVLPCGAGKTVIGIATMARLGSATLILTTNVTSVRQWKREILEKTDLSGDLVGEYTGTTKEVRPVTIATYQILTHRKNKEAEFLHMSLFNERDWGLIIYDAVHLLPAPVFRATADIQATRRLGLTATLVREDGREEDVFSLVGPKRFDMPWKDLEREGWIAKAECVEIRVPLPAGAREKYAAAEPKQKHRIAGENELKLKAVERLLLRHRGEPTLIIGQYLDQLKRISATFGAPLISGEMTHDDRERLYARFKQGDIDLLVVSKVANFAVDLPDAAVAVQVSGSFGSRQEEAQRLGRILRPKPGTNESFFYSVVSRDTREQDFAMKRQLFLVEQGYRYRIEDAEKLLEPEVIPS